MTYARRPSHMIEKDEADPLTKMSGVAFALLLIVGAIVALSWGDGSVEPRMEAAANQTPGMVAWWREDVNQLPLLLGIVLALSPMILVPGAFGVRSRQLLPMLRPRWRAALVAALAMMIAADGLAYRMLGGRDIGVATTEGATWLRNGLPRERWRWEQAIGVSGGCWTSRRNSLSEPTYGLNYLVHFPNGRDARLSFRIQDVGPWASQVRVIDDRLTAAGVTRAMEDGAGCLAHYSESISKEDGDVLRHVLRP